MKKQHQSGAVLIVSLILLLVLTIIGFSGSQTVIMQEKMTAAVQDSHLALQSAELGLKTAEKFIEDNVTKETLTKFSNGTASDSGIVGLYGIGQLPTNVFEDSVWQSTNSKQATKSIITDDIAAPRYIIENLGISTDEGNNATLNIVGYGETKTVGDVNVFKVVARGQGRSSETERVIVAYIGKRL